MRGKLIYRTFSLYRTIKATVFRLLALGAGLLAIWHFEDNPILTSIVFGLGLLIFLTAGDDEISIYEDRIKIAGGSFRNAIRKRNTHEYAHIRAIDVVGTVGRKEEIEGDIIIALPGHILPGRKSNQIRVTRSNGEVIIHDMRIFRKEIDTALEKIPSPFNTLVNKL